MKSTVSNAYAYITALCHNAIVSLLISFRSTDQSHFAAQSAHFLPNTTQATRITSAMFTEKSLRVKSCSTVHTAHSPRVRELWRRMLKYSTCPHQHVRTMETHRELHLQRRTNPIWTELEWAMVLRKQCIIAKNARSGTLSTML